MLLLLIVPIDVVVDCCVLVAFVLYDVVVIAVAVVIDNKYKK